MYFLRRLAYVLRRSRHEADLRAEIEAHRALRQERLERDGVIAIDARHASARSIGNVTLAREDVREVWGWPWLEGVAQDVRVGLRMLLKRRAVMSMAIASLALGIGANTAVFSLVNATFVQPLPYPDSDRLVMLWAIADERPDIKQRTNAGDYLAWKTRARSFEAMGTDAPVERDLGADDNGAPAERVRIQRYTSSLFQVLRVRPVIGRVVSADEDPLGAPAPVALISEALWERRFNRDPGVLGRRLRVDGTSATVIGVMPAEFSYLASEPVDLWVPFAMNRPETQGTGRGYTIAARLAPGTTIRQAQAEMDVIAAGLVGEKPALNRGWTVRVEPLRQAFFGTLTRPLMFLQGLVGIVLLIACANVASLLLALATSRGTEIALRTAIGAGRGRIVRQLLTESVLLGLAGGAAGIAVAWAGMQALRVFTAGFVLAPDAMAIDGRVLAFTVITSAATGVVFGLAPAIQASRVDLIDSLKGPATIVMDRPRGHRLRGGLVVAQMALALVLLSAAGLLVNSFVRLSSNDLGADPKGVLAFAVSFQGPRFSQAVGAHAGFPLRRIDPVVSSSFGRIWERIQHLPGIEAAAGINHTPFTATAQNVPFRLDDDRAPEATTGPSRAARLEIVTPRVFETLRIPIVAGRDFTDADTAGSPWGVIVNETMARMSWPNESPLGKRLTLQLTPGDQPREVIGVVGDVRTALWLRDPAPVMYTLHRQQPPQGGGPVNDRVDMTFVVRAADGSAAIQGIHRVMKEIDPDRPVGDIRPLAQHAAAQINWQRRLTTLFAVIAAAATLLAALGLYGLVAHDVSQRTREIGIRLALGAGRSDVSRLIFKRVLRLLTIGLAIGVPSALALARLISSQLWGITPTDTPTYALVSLLMAAVAIVAAAVPTRRATRVAPTVALRCE